MSYIFLKKSKVNHYPSTAVPPQSNICVTWEGIFVRYEQRLLDTVRNNFFPLVESPRSTNLQEANRDRSQQLQAPEGNIFSENLLTIFGDFAIFIGFN